MTVTGKPIGENIAGHEIWRGDVIHSRRGAAQPRAASPSSTAAWRPTARWSRAPQCAPEMLVHCGPARVFEQEEPALAAIFAGEIQPGDVVVIRYEGPKGGPGMREQLMPTSAIIGMGLGEVRGAGHRRALLGRHAGRLHRPRHA